MFDAGDVEQLQPGQMKLISAGQKHFLLARAADGVYYAVRSICPHQGVDLSKGRLTGRLLPSAVGVYDYVNDYEVLRCPRHGYEFDITTGASWFDPAHMRIKTYPVEVADGRVLVDL